MLEGEGQKVVVDEVSLPFLANAEIEVSELEFGGVAYWRIVAEDQSEVPAAFYVSILPDHLAAAIYPLAQEADFLPSFLGLDAPAESAAAERLAALSGEYGFTPYGAAYLDLHRLADEFMDPASRTAVALNAAGVYDSEKFTPQCVAEAHRIIDNMPMVAAGVTELDVTAMQYRGRAGREGARRPSRGDVLRNQGRGRAGLRARESPDRGR